MIGLKEVLLGVLLIFSIIDWKFKKVPSAFLTGFIFVTAIVHFYNFETGMISLSFGILAFIFAWALYELGYLGGIADVKMIVIIGLMITSMQMFFVFLLMIVLFGMAYRLVFKYFLKEEKPENIPFLPSLYAVYVALYFIGGVA